MCPHMNVECVFCGSALNCSSSATGRRKGGTTKSICMILHLNSSIVLSAFEKYCITDSPSCCLISGILCTTDVTDGAALKSVSKLGDDNNDDVW